MRKGSHGVVGTFLHNVKHYVKQHLVVCKVIIYRFSFLSTLVLKKNCPFFSKVHFFISSVYAEIRTELPKILRTNLKEKKKHSIWKSFDYYGNKKGIES